MTSQPRDSKRPPNIVGGFWVEVRLHVEEANGKQTGHRGYLPKVEEIIQSAVTKANRKYKMRTVRLEVTAEPKSRWDE